MWIACHGYGQLAAPFAQALEPLDDPTRVILVPEALNRFYPGEALRLHGPDSPVGATWMTREDRESEITDYVEYLDLVASTIRREMHHADVKVVALGFSQGVATVCRWAALGKTRVDRLIMWAGTIPPDLPTDSGDGVFRGATLVMIAGRDDRLITPKVIERQQRALAERGLHAELVSFDGGHTLNTEVLRRVAAANSDA